MRFKNQLKLQLECYNVTTFLSLWTHYRIRKGHAIACCILNGTRNGGFLPYSNP